MKTVREILNLSSEYLEKYHIKSPRRNAEEILAHILNIKRIDLYMDIDRPLEEGELERCRALLRRRAQGEPLDYLWGYKEFFGVDVHLNQNVLIPRQETELLVAHIVDTLKKTGFTRKKALGCVYR